MTAPAMKPPALLFGIPVDDVTMQETLDLIVALVAHGRANGTTHQIATVNVDFLVNALGDPETRSILQKADVCLPDGMPVIWGSRPLGMPLRERVAGSDLVPLLIDASRSNGCHVHVFGSSVAVADAARTMLQERYPGARFSIDPGPMIADVREVPDDVLDSIAEVDADILCIALGNPKQERFIQAHRSRLGAPVMMGVGGSLDMLVGLRRRAPIWMQRLGLEWVARAAQEPRRLGRRYAHDIRVIAPAFLDEWRISLRRRRGAGAQVSIGADCVRVRLSGDRIATDEIWAIAADRVLAGASVHVDAAGARTVRAAALAQVVGLVRLTHRGRGGVSWEGIDDAIADDWTRTGLSAALNLYMEWPTRDDP
jgi:N-acetylglucosaminyldiphosphoundecaprenol N-acetyl-beta-D-mannosaminyltransferase